ncbi:hypothetical protein PAHAL_9G147000 [Panicum hallii]|uniref:Uncharacterized protein n=1 Tax=Panicum hallii TaxID=206008 RepID=A0A2T8I178_9POAL|nr:hypothetical protein PAHAL_9G147000 [Panicum hallii]
MRVSSRDLLCSPLRRRRHPPPRALLPRPSGSRAHLRAPRWELARSRMPPLPALPLASAASPNPSCFPRPTSALAREIVPNPPPPPHIPAPPLTSGARRRGGSSVSVGGMSRRGKSVPQLGGGPEKRGGGTPPAVPTPPAAPPQSQSAPPPPNGPWFPGCGGSSGQSSFSHGIEPGNPCNHIFHHRHIRLEKISILLGLQRTSTHHLQHLHHRQIRSALILISMMVMRKLGQLRKDIGHMMRKSDWQVLG